MIKITVDDAKGIIISKAEGLISEADIDSAVSEIQERYPQIGLRLRGGGHGVGLLFDWRLLEGWELGAKTFGTLTVKMLSDLVNKVAIVAEEKWRDEELRVRDSSKGREVKFFTSDKLDKAEQWLQKK